MAQLIFFVPRSDCLEVPWVQFLLRVTQALKFDNTIGKQFYNRGPHKFILVCLQLLARIGLSMDYIFAKTRWKTLAF